MTTSFFPIFNSHLYSDDIEYIVNRLCILHTKLHVINMSSL